MEANAYPLNATDSHVNSAYIALVMQAQRHGLGCLPDRLGLSDTQYADMAQCFGHLLPVSLNQQHPPHSENGLLRQQLLELRSQEWQDVTELLLAHRNKQHSSEIYIAQIVAAACLGSSHLWQDLGLPNRDMLKVLMHDNFASLFHLNDKDMRWKKFFYRQLCEQEGHYVCRSPSCESCSTYDECFGEEL